MNCVKCGFDIPDGSVFCPSCGTKQTVQESAAPVSESVSPVISAAPAAAASPVQPAVSAAPAGAGTAPNKASAGQGNTIGGFFKAYFKNPIEAVIDHAKDEFWLWGLIVLAAYSFLIFIISLKGAFGGGGSYFVRYSLLQFVYLLTDLIKFATLIFALFLFQSIFKVKKKSLKSIVALSGLAFLPLIATDLLSTLFSSVFILNNLVSGLITATYVFAGILIFLDYKESSEDTSGLKSVFLTLCSFACMPIVSSIFIGIANWVYSKSF